MASRRRPSKSGSPLDERQRKLAEEEEKIARRAEQLNRMIAEAPRIKAERARAQRDELLVERSSRANHRLNSNTLTDVRYDPFSGRGTSRSRRRPLKAERRQTLLIFLSLVVVLALLVFWLLSAWHWQWPG